MSPTSDADYAATRDLAAEFSVSQPCLCPKLTLAMHHEAASVLCLVRFISKVALYKICCFWRKASGKPIESVAGCAGSAGILAAKDGRLSASEWAICGHWSLGWLKHSFIHYLYSARREIPIEPLR